MFENDPDYKRHELDKDFSLLEPHDGKLWRMAAIYLVNHEPKLHWEYGICPIIGAGSVMPCSADQLKMFLGEDLFDEATAYVEAKISAYFEKHGITDPRLVPNG